MASLTTVAAAAVVTVAMGLQVETSHMHPVVLPAIHHGPPGPAQVELDNQAPQPVAKAVTQAAPVPAHARPAPATAESKQAGPCAATGLDAGSALVRLPIHYLAAWSAMAEALGFVAVGGDEPANLREQLNGMTGRIPHPTCSR